ncbi:hypothetical protein PanWU01x14_150460 [Parasponia andersonii]|uniref:Uncharacterized protein n=1 Tax=Parasponia andersonii TaxID=3476 RepID=A0A2P5CI80_PARAD|nr:hypothetical protein PanWU01x14_150460 [Parasponia andersonii]
MVVTSSKFRDKPVIIAFSFNQEGKKKSKTGQSHDLLIVPWMGGAGLARAAILRKSLILRHSGGLSHSSQLELLNLPCRGLGQVFHKHHLLWHHKVRHILPAIAHDVGFRHMAAATLQRHESARTLAPPRVRHRHHRGLQNLGVFVQHALHLHAANVLSTRYNHVLRPILYFQVPIWVDHSHVSRQEPPVLKHIRRRFGVLEIPLHDATPS